MTGGQKTKFAHARNIQPTLLHLHRRARLANHGERARRDAAAFTGSEGRHEFAERAMLELFRRRRMARGRVLLTGLNDAAFQQSGERGGGDGGGRLHIEADPAQFEQSFFDLNFRNCDGRAAGTPQGGQDFTGPHRLRDRRAVRDCRRGLNWRKIAGPGLEACVKRRAILRLRSEQPSESRSRRGIEAR